MHLWTEYEGKTVNGDYTLGRLLRSEGRNGFFATADKKGQQAVIRLTEAHFDEDQQLARWRQVSVLKQPHLIGIDNVGRADLDGVSLTFALMESDDANLEEVLKERPLTTAEALQVARAVTEALQSLHASGLVHEHIEPANVMAVGEVVKLRSDCVRECVADGEFRTQEGCAELRRKDVNALAVLLLRCLTLDSEIRPGAPLPEPFYRILPGALAGTLSLDQISAILGPSDEAKAKAEALAAERAASAKAAQEEAQIIAEKTAEPVVAKPTVASAPAPKAATPVPAAAAVRTPAAAEPSPAMPPNFRPRNEHLGRSRGEQPAQDKRMIVWGACGVALLVLLFALWHMFSGSSKPKPAAQTAAAVVPAAPTAAAASQPAPVVVPVAHGWHVIAYTYNHAGQAQAKADSIARKHGNLNPQVFSPTSHGPYLVALGGVMSEAEAKATLQRARRSGMPRDAFMRNY